MSVDLYPVPGTEKESKEFIQPFLDSTIAEDGLAPDHQFIILLFGEEASEEVNTIENAVRDHSATAEQALEIGQLTVQHLDERRLNTFTTSLLYNLLHLDSDAPLDERIKSDEISDEDERKIDYYLPRVNESVSEMVQEHRETFETRLSETFPVELESDRIRDMNERLEMDIVTSQTIIDFLLLAAGATEDPEGVRSFVKYLREQRIDSTGYLSGGSDRVAGYKRVFSISFNLTSNEFNDEFQTARSLYADGTTSELFRILNEVDTALELNQIYTHESPVEALLTSQFTGNDREIAERLLRTINGTRVVENHRDRVTDAYQDAREELAASITAAQDAIESLTQHNDRFDTAKIQIDTTEVDQFETLLDRADEIDSLVVKYLLGFDRDKRTSVFTTLTARIDEYRRSIEEFGDEIDSYIGALQTLENRCDTQLSTLNRSYEKIEESSVAIKLPDQSAVEREFESEWQARLDKCQSELPVVDLEADEEAIEDVLEDWETSIDNAREDLHQISRPIDRLESFAGRIQELEEEREQVREKLDGITALMEGQP